MVFEMVLLQRFLMPCFFLLEDFYYPIISYFYTVLVVKFVDIFVEFVNIIAVRYLST